jgi:Fe-S cluster biogenesis protein NfuA
MSTATDGEVQAALADLNLALRTHGGAVECVGTENGTLRLRMSGLCAACLERALAASYRPPSGLDTAVLA